MLTDFSCSKLHVKTNGVKLPENSAARSESAEVPCRIFGLLFLLDILTCNYGFWNTRWRYNTRTETGKHATIGPRLQGMGMNAEWTVRMNAFHTSTFNPQIFAEGIMDFLQLLYALLEAFINWHLQLDISIWTVSSSNNWVPTLKKKGTSRT